MSNPISAIQCALKAPKSQYNAHRNFSYRNCEDILEGLKPILKSLDCYLLISDKIVNIGNRFYIEATVRLFDTDNKILAEVTAYAREDEDRKGFDQPQLTGCSSSYARKYALNGMFMIDDAEDPDSLKKDQKQSNKSPAHANTEYNQATSEGDDNKPWLNQNTKEWTDVVNALKGAYTIEDILKRYKISKANREALKGM